VAATAHGADGAVRFTRAGAGHALLGGPLTALTWLANELSSRGIGLMAGEWASCGTCMVPLEVLPGDRVTADYGVLGVIGVGVAG
jgi:2-keto-4-pentenoate hydratase